LYIFEICKGYSQYSVYDRNCETTIKQQGH
jgi:hypothetical protein